MIQKKINILLFIIGMLLLNLSNIYAQETPDIDITLNFADPVGHVFNGNVHFGLDVLATDGFDLALGENMLPPWSPALEARFQVTTEQSYKEYRNAPSYPYSGTKVQHLVWVYEMGSGTNEVTISYNLPTGVTIQLQDEITGSIFNSGTLSGAGNYSIIGLTAAKVTIVYTNVSPAVAIFNVSPASPLTLPTTVVTTSNTSNVTVNNTGSVSLNVTGITSSNTEFTISPTTATIAAGGNQVFTVTFTPTSAGVKTSNLVFTHNAAGSPTTYVVNGTAVPPSPIYSASPASLNFSSVALGANSVLPVTITNTGTLQLDISNIVSNNAQFTFAPATFPINIAAGASQTINVTFTPTVLGSVTANLTFTHNASGSPSDYALQGVGANAVGFSVSPTTLNFGTVNQPNSATQTVTVTNNGIASALVISSAATSSPFSVTPTSANIVPGGSQVFSVTFTPTTGGTSNGTLSFTHNATGSPSAVSLTGDSPSISGLIFKRDQQTRREEDSYTDTLTLRNLNLASGAIQALQFKLLVNATSSEDTVLRFANLTKGSNVSGANWILEYNVVRGAATLGASVDTVFALLYNLNQAGGLNLTNYSDLLRVTYQVVDLPVYKDSALSIIKITNAYASTVNGAPISITPNPNSLQINVWNRVSGNSLGDANGDGTLDILDLINVVDHIVNRDSLAKTPTPGLSTSEFFRANIAPWGSPDAVVNVQDLALIQNIILTGEYPNGDPVSRSKTFAGNSESALNKLSSQSAKITIKFTDAGVSIISISDVEIRGAQIEFNSLSTDNSNFNIQTNLGVGFYSYINELLRVLLYDPAGEMVIPAGENELAFIPVSIENPQAITIDKIILVSGSTTKIENVEVKLVYSSDVIPTDYSLSQNFPNPFNPSTTVKFSIPQDGLVTIKVFNMLGEEITTLFSGNTQKGSYTLNWNGKDNSGNFVSSGSYIYRMTAGDFTQSKKMMFLK